MIIISIIFILSLVYCNYYVTAHLNIYIYRICALEVNKLLLLLTNPVFKPIKGEVDSKV